MEIGLEAQTVAWRAAEAFATTLYEMLIEQKANCFGVSMFESAAGTEKFIGSLTTRLSRLSVNTPLAVVTIRTFPDVTKQEYAVRHTYELAIGLPAKPPIVTITKGYRHVPGEGVKLVETGEPEQRLMLPEAYVITLTPKGNSVNVRLLRNILGLEKRGAGLTTEATLTEQVLAEHDKSTENLQKALSGVLQLVARRDGALAEVVAGLSNSCYGYALAPPTSLEVRSYWATLGPDTFTFGGFGGRQKEVAVYKLSNKVFGTLKTRLEEIVLRTK